MNSIDFTCHVLSLSNITVVYLTQPNFVLTPPKSHSIVQPMAAAVELELNLEQQHTPEGSRISVAYHPGFARYYHEFYSQLLKHLYFDGPTETLDGKHFPIGLAKKQVDNADFYAILDQNKSTYPDCVIAPAWFAPPMDKALFHIAEMANAFTHSQSSTEPAFTQRFLALFPYAELRQDKNSPLAMRTYWNEKAREAITAQILANTLKANGVTEAIILEPHSAEAMDYFNAAGIETLCLTTAPIFADWLITKNYVDANTNVVGLDEGSAQKCLHLQIILRRKTNLPIGLSVLRKHRSGHSEVDQETLIFGNPKGKKAIIFDDLGASFESIFKTGQALIQNECPLIIPCLAHAVFAGKYLENITDAANKGIIPRVAVTDSLPQSDFANFLPVPIDVLPVEQMLAFFAREVAIRSIEEVKNDPHFQDFILTPRPKKEVVASLCL